MPIPVDQIEQALKEIGLEHPSLSTVRLDGNRVRLAITAICYPERHVPVAAPRQVTTLPRAAPGLIHAEPVPSEAEGTDDLTTVPGIGKATAAKLNEAGIKSLADLAAASDEDLLACVSRKTLARIREG